MSAIKNFIKTHPRLYDSTKRVHRALFGTNELPIKFLDEYSKKTKGPFRFLQIGASDGLRSDLVREFIVRDRWSGVLVEPLPYAFGELKRNYAHLEDQGLIFVNAVVSATTGALTFWSFSDEFLSRLNVEERFDYLRKSSLHRQHVENCLKARGLDDSVIVSSRIECVTYQHLQKSYFDERPMDLLAIDAEGHEPAIIESIGFGNPRERPRCILFESHNLGTGKQPLFDFLKSRDYEIVELGGDAAAIDRAA
jgi:FkbM family methyltransferase